jgi:hypothetical protein
MAGLKREARLRADLRPSTAFPFGEVIAFSSETDSGSREENASKQQSGEATPFLERLRPGMTACLSTVSTILGDRALYASDFSSAGALTPDIARR